MVFRSQDSEIPAEDKSSFESVSDVFSKYVLEVALDLELLLNLNRVVNLCTFFQWKTVYPETVGVLTAEIGIETVFVFTGECGVVHTHENRKVIGSSKVEDHVTRCAIQDVYELHQYSQEPAIQCNPLSEVRCG